MTGAGGGRPHSIAEIAARAALGSQPFDPAVREFFDSWQTMDEAGRLEAIGSEPCRVGPVQDAYLAAVAEHLAQSHALAAPAWSERPERFLQTPYFAGGLESLKATLIVESPAAFRRRLIFISADALSRPCRNSGEDDASHVPNPDG